MDHRNLDTEYNEYYNHNGEMDDTILSEATVNTSVKRKKIVDLICKTISIVDESGLNTKKYKDFFNSMDDNKFNNYMKKFLNDESDNFYLEILPNHNEPSLTQIKKALDHINVPMDEHVYLRHDGHKDDPIRTMYKVPVGYIHLKRMQQILSKKNTYSLDISKRNMKTNQTTGDSKIARITDAENYALSTINADSALKEFLGARADSSDKKMELYKQINMYGYAYQKDLPDNLEENQTLNTITMYLLGAGIDNDLLEPVEEEELLR